MQRTFNTRQAFEMILSKVNPNDSDGEDKSLQPSLYSELSQLSSGQISFHVISYFIFHFKQERGKYTKGRVE